VTINNNYVRLISITVTDVNVFYYHRKKQKTLIVYWL